MFAGWRRSRSLAPGLMTANDQMPDPLERRLTAILAPDVEGFSRHIGREDRFDIPPTPLARADEVIE
jgi:hypothetical protein